MQKEKLNKVYKQELGQSNSTETANQLNQVNLNAWYRYLSIISLIILLFLCVAWELFLDPLVPGGSLYVLKALPLIFPIYGVYKGNLYTMQWASMLVLLYVLEGTVRWYSDLSPISRNLAMFETVLSITLFMSLIFYVRPAKKLAKKLKKQGK